MKLHIAIATHDLEASVADYSARLGAQPCSYVAGAYALWRTASLNLSLRHDPETPPGTLRHLGWEDPSANAFTQDEDVNGIVWERFSAEHQADEINALWPQARYQPSSED